MAAQERREWLFVAGLSPFWFALSYQLVPESFAALSGFSVGSPAFCLGSLLQCACAIAIALACLLAAGPRKPGNPSGRQAAGRRCAGLHWPPLLRAAAFYSAGLCLLLVALSPLAPCGPLASASSVLCSTLFSLFTCATALQWARISCRIGTKRACLLSAYSFLANLLIALLLTVVLGSLGAEQLFGPIAAFLPLASAVVAFVPLEGSTAAEGVVGHREISTTSGATSPRALIASPYTLMAAALLFYLFASYLFSGLFSHPGMPFSTTLLSKLLAVALAGALAALVSRANGILPRKGRSGFLRVLVFFTLICVTVSYLVAMLMGNHPDLCEQLVLPTRILALFLLWETALMYSVAEGVPATAAVAALFLIPLGIEMSFAMFARFVTPLIADLPAYLWLGACIIPAMLLLILAVLNLQTKTSTTNTPAAAGNLTALGAGNAAAATSTPSTNADGAPVVRGRNPSSEPATSPAAVSSASPCAEDPNQPEAPGSPLSARCDEIASQFGLTPREREVLQLLAAGNSHRKIADVLVISLSSAQTYSKNIYRKLGVHSRQEVIDLISQNDRAL